jgi:hypothetical protein
MTINNVAGLVARTLDAVRGVRTPTDSISL